MNYVLVQVPPPLPDLPRPRFSLYLSSQLQYGVIVVYRRQCALLLEEVESIVGKLVKQRTPKKIDLDDHSRKSLDNTDSLLLMEEAEGAPDPLFGVMYMQDTTASPSTIMQMSQQYRREASPEHPDPARPDAAAAAAASAGESDITASPDSITLREAEPPFIPAAEFEGADQFADQFPDTIDILMAQTDEFPEALEVPRGVTAEEQEREVGRGGEEADLDKERTKEITASTIELQPQTLSTEDTMISPQEEPGLSVEQPGPRPGQLTPTSVLDILSPPSAPKAPQRPRAEPEAVPAPREPVRRRGRKRQLVFFDPETQLPEKVLRQQINDLQIETRPPKLLPPSSLQRLSAAELLNNPCNPLPAEVEFLWRRAATVKPISGSDLIVGERGPESSESELERQARDVAEAIAGEEEEEEEEERAKLSPSKMSGDVAEPEMADVSGLGVLPLEGSDQREASREISPFYTPEAERSPVSRSVATLEDILEVQDEQLDRAASPGLLPELAGEHEVIPVLFQSLLPPKVNRRTVSNVFQRLLGALSTRTLRAEQEEPYGDIHIFPGHDFEQAQMSP
ncbi:uncharacterized protein V6R79_003743 [Siganus canaliculatus]